MSTNTALTDTQIIQILEENRPEYDGLDKAIAVSRAIEQAVLTKLAEQHTPTAWLNKETGDVISSELKDDAPEMLKGYDVPLYRCPDFSCQGLLDGSDHVADAGETVMESEK